jgi:hypothetical protein
VYLKFAHFTELFIYYLQTAKADAFIAFSAMEVLASYEAIWTTDLEWCSAALSRKHFPM